MGISFVSGHAADQDEKSSQLTNKCKTVREYKLDEKEKQWEVKDKIRIEHNDEVYALEQFHFHQPAEHTLNGDKFPLEMHFVFQSTSCPNATLALAFVAKLICDKQSNKSKNESKHRKDDKHDTKPDKPRHSSRLFRQILNNEAFKIPTFDGYWSYPGSLTTPPLTNNVNWIVSNSILKVTESDLKRLVSKESRPLQARKGRDIVYVC